MKKARPEPNEPAGASPCCANGRRCGQLPRGCRRAGRVPRQASHKPAARPATTQSGGAVDAFQPRPAHKQNERRTAAPSARPAPHLPDAGTARQTRQSPSSAPGAPKRSRSKSCSARSRSTARCARPHTAFPAWRAPRRSKPAPATTAPGPAASAQSQRHAAFGHDGRRERPAAPGPAPRRRPKKRPLRRRRFQCRCCGRGPGRRFFGKSPAAGTARPEHKRSASRLCRPCCRRKRRRLQTALPDMSAAPARPASCAGCLCG